MDNPINALIFVLVCGTLFAAASEWFNRQGM